MVVRFEDVLDAHPEVAREAQVLLDVELRVHNGCDAGVLVADQIARAAKVVVGDLTEDHAAASRRLTGSPASVHAPIPPSTFPAS